MRVCVCLSVCLSVCVCISFDMISLVSSVSVMNSMFYNVVISDSTLLVIACLPLQPVVELCRCES